MLLAFMSNASYSALKWRSAPGMPTRLVFFEQLLLTQCINPEAYASGGSDRLEQNLSKILVWLWNLWILPCIPIIRYYSLSWFLYMYYKWLSIILYLLYTCIHIVWYSMISMSTCVCFSGTNVMAGGTVTIDKKQDETRRNGQWS